MRLLHLFAIAAGGAAGAVSRYLIAGWVSSITRQSPFPYGTLSVNFLGSIILGLAMGAMTSGRLALPSAARAFLTIGLLGAFTTFSTFSYESVQALRLGDLRVLFANLFLSLLLCFGGCWAGLRLGRLW